MLQNYFLIAWRHLTKNKVYSFINIAGLSIGLACAMLIILYVKDEVSYDRFHADGANIYRIVSENTDRKNPAEHGWNGNTGFLQGPRFSANVPGIQSFTRVRDHRIDIKNGTEIQSKPVLKVDSTFFNIFSFPLLQGDRRSCLKDPYSIVLSQDEAKKQFGTTDAVGKVVMVKKDSSFVPYTVTAVAKRCPQNSSIKFDMLIPTNVSPEDMAKSESWFNVFLNTFVVLQPKTGKASVEAGMERFYTADSKQARQEITAKYGPVLRDEKYWLQPFANMHLDKTLPANNGLSDASNPMYAYILSGIALFILLIACINFVNLTVARSVKRAKEIGIRKVVGGERSQLITQFLGESFLLCVIAFGLALLLVTLILPVFNELSNKSLALSYLFDGKLVTGYIGLLIITSLLAGFYPALVLSGYNPVQTLYSRFMLGGKNYLQKSLVVLQFVLASFLIIVTMIIFAQFDYLTTRELGYDDSQLIVVPKSNIKRSEVGVLKNELLKNPNITGVAMKNGGDWATVAKINGNNEISFDWETVDDAYFPLLKIPIVKGRNFSPAYPSDSMHAVLVNEAFVKEAGWKDPIGQELDFWFDKEKFAVVGVVKDHHYKALNQTIRAQVFTMKPSNNYGIFFAKIKPGSETASLRHIETVFRQLYPLLPYSYSFKDEENYKLYQAEAKWKQIMLFGAILTIAISCIGLFGLSVLSAEKRTKEIGIRKVLGASVRSVATSLSKDFLKLVFIALVCSIPLAWLAAQKWLESYPYRITVGWPLFVYGAVLVVLIALFTVSFQAVKAALANPVKSLRSE